MKWLHKFVCFNPAISQAKSAQLISTVLPFHPLYFPCLEIRQIGFYVVLCLAPTISVSKRSQKKFAKKKDLKRTFLLKYIIFLPLYDCWCISFQYCHIPNAGPESALEHLVKIRIFHPKCIILSENVSEGRRRIFSNTSRVMDKNIAN